MAELPGLKTVIREDPPTKVRLRLLLTGVHASPGCTRSAPG